jgi:hypothetical protein
MARLTAAPLLALSIFLIVSQVFARFRFTAAALIYCRADADPPWTWKRLGPPAGGRACMKLSALSVSVTLAMSSFLPSPADAAPSQGASLIPQAAPDLTGTMQYRPRPTSGSPGYCWYYTNPQRTQGFWNERPL